MSVSHFRHVKVAGLKVLLPAHKISVDDELEYFDNNPKKLDRQKRMIGFGDRYIADKRVTITDMALDAVRRLMAAMKRDASEIQSLVVVDHSPDYLGPCDACVLHGRLGLRKGIPAFDINIGCSGYLYGLLTASSLIESRAVGNCLLVAGDIPSRGVKQSNRKRAPLFSDSVSATLVEWTEDEVKSTIVCGTDGSGWEAIVKPVGGLRIPLDENTMGLKSVDSAGNEWTPDQEMMAGEDVFKFTMDVVPQLINDVVDKAGWRKEEVDLFAIHQANKQIVEMLVSKADLPLAKTPVDIFSRYANTTLNSAMTVLAAQKDKSHLNKVILASFGAGLSWAGAALDFSSSQVGEVEFYETPEDMPTSDVLVEKYINRFKNG